MQEPMLFNNEEELILLLDNDKYVNVLGTVHTVAKSERTPMTQ